MSTMPGARTRPLASTRCRAAPRSWPIAAMRPSFTATPPARAGVPRPSMTRALSMTRSCMGGSILRARRSRRMPDRPDAFVGTVPQHYDRYLGPVLFHGFADDLAARVTPRPGIRVLEVAAGTGIVTRRLLARVRGHGTLVATDLNEAMMAHGRREVPADPALEWRQADATALPFPDRTFDAVVCQFGLMFFPDKALAAREAFRVLTSGGVYLFNVWDAFEHNPIADITHRTVIELFPADPPQFYATPYGFSQPEPIVALLTQAGFAQIAWSRVAKTGSSPSAESTRLN